MKPSIKPMLCEGYPKVFNDSQYIWERKLDGARILPFVNGSDVHLQARSGTDKTHTFPELRVETRLPAILDGEVVSAQDLSFQDSIQHRINKVNNVEFASKLYPAKLVIFDVLEIDGKNVEALPLESRKRLLQSLVVPTNTVELSSFTEDGEALWQDVLKNGWEGAVGKRKAGSYVRNARDWLKVKAWKRNYGKESTGETILAVGYTQGTGWRQSTFGAMVLARLEADGSSTYVGEVGTGFNDAETARGRIQSVRPALGERQLTGTLPTFEELAESFPELAQGSKVVHPITGEELTVEEATVAVEARKNSQTDGSMKQ